MLRVIRGLVGPADCKPDNPASSSCVVLDLSLPALHSSNRKAQLWRLQTVAFSWLEAFRTFRTEPFRTFYRKVVGTSCYLIPCRRLMNRKSYDTERKQLSVFLVGLPRPLGHHHSQSFEEDGSIKAHPPLKILPLNQSQKQLHFNPALGRKGWLLYILWNRERFVFQALLRFAFKRPSVSLEI